jgi:uncharacterized protein YdgA (DUF945 family)
VIAERGVIITEKIMKKIAGLVVILAVLVLGGYYGMGIATERAVKHNLDAINKSNGLSVKVVEYKRKWFKSTALLDWRLNVPERIAKSEDGQSVTVPAQDFEMQMPMVIHHGPVIFVNKTVKFGLGYANTEIPIPEKYNEQFDSLFTSESVKPKLILSMFVNYFNNSQVEMSVPSFKLIGKQGQQFEWKGMTSFLDLGSNASKIKGEFNVEGMLFSKDDIKAQIGEINTDYDLKKSDTGLYLGDANASLPSILVNKKDEKLFELTDFDVHSSCDVENSLFGSQFKMSIDKIFAAGKLYGPGNLEMAIKNLDADVLARINQQVNQAQNGTEAERQQAMLAILPEVPKLFGRGAEFEISELSFVMPQGTIEGNLQVSLPAGDTANPFELMQKIKGKGKLKVPAEVIKLALNESNKQKILANQNTAQPADPSNVADAIVSATSPAPAPATDAVQQAAAMTNEQINAMVQSGLIVQDSTYYVVEVSLDQGSFMVNGKPFNAAMLKF